MKSLAYSTALATVLILAMPTSLNLASSVEQLPAEEQSDVAEIEENKDEQEMPAEKLIRVDFGYEKLPDGTQQPWRLVRSLQLSQDDIVAGKARAEDAYRLLVLKLERLMGAMNDPVWNHERNLDALAVFILLGGNTELGYKALQKTKLDSLQKQPLEAALAYAERDLSRARILLQEFDYGALPPSMSANFAMARSMVVASTDIGLASSYLNEARRLAPGTLVEEAALRRLIRIAGEKRSYDDFTLLSRSYIRRFRKSHYFKDFLTNLSFGIVRMPKDKEKELLAFLQEVLRDVDFPQRTIVSMYVARHSITSGKNTLSRWASMKSLEYLAKGSLAHARMQLYLAAIEVVNKDKTGAAKNTLEALTKYQFDSVDSQILSSAILLSKQILQHSIAPTDTDMRTDEVAMDEVKTTEEDPALMAAIEGNAVLQRASQIVDQSNDALKGAVQ